VPEGDRVLLERYAAGVNAGLRQPTAQPFDGLPGNAAAVVAQDTLLVVWAMFLTTGRQLHRVFRAAGCATGARPPSSSPSCRRATGYDAPSTRRRRRRARTAARATPPGSQAGETRCRCSRPGNAEVGSNNWVVAGGGRAARRSSPTTCT
jgi:penicillin amidase